VEKLLTPSEVSAITGLSVESLKNMRYASKNGPKFIKLGKNVRYAESALEEWIQANVYVQTKVKA
jgi:predicted DNA-binding transcriptional regulator AlpA